AVGDGQTQGLEEPLEELRIGAVGPVPYDAEVVPAGDAVARTDDVRRQAVCLEGGRTPLGDIEDVRHGRPSLRSFPPRPGDCMLTGRIHEAGRGLWGSVAGVGDDPMLFRSVLCSNSMYKRAPTIKRHS